MRDRTITLPPRPDTFVDQVRADDDDPRHAYQADKAPVLHIDGCGRLSYRRATR